MSELPKTKPPRCPVCKQLAEVSERGLVRLAWREKWSHRDPNGEPCEGVVKVRKAG